MQILTNKRQNTLVVPPLYLGSVDFYAEMLKHEKICFDINAPYDDMRAINRCRIATAGGVQTLTIPLVKPEYGRHTQIKELRISSHGKWEHLHWGAIYSAYGKAPFFEYIEPDLKHLYERHGEWLADFNIALHNLIADYMQLDIPQVKSTENSEKISPLYAGKDDVESTVGSYWQVRAEKFGFTPHLSILDIALNEGPQGIFALLKSGSEK